jgi:hypothetical protein
MPKPEYCWDLTTWRPPDVDAVRRTAAWTHRGRDWYWDGESLFSVVGASSYPIAYVTERRDAFMFSLGWTAGRDMDPLVDEPGLPLL